MNPGDNHSCMQRKDSPLDYRGLNITKERMRELTEELVGEKRLPQFSQNVIFRGEDTELLQSLHQRIMDGRDEIGREEGLLLLIFRLIQTCGQCFRNDISEYREEIKKACSFVEQHFAERIFLEQISRHAGLSKSTLLRAFTKSKGITPYNYLLNIRISEARKRLEEGCSPAEAALQTGFSDQSHFTNCFHRFIGLTPGGYRDIFLKHEKCHKETKEETQ